MKSERGSFLFWPNRDVFSRESMVYSAQQIKICKGDIRHEERLLSGFASFNDRVRIIALGSSLYFCSISNRKSKRNILIL